MTIDWVFVGHDHRDSNTIHNEIIEIFAYEAFVKKPNAFVFLELQLTRPLRSVHAITFRAPWQFINAILVPRNTFLHCFRF